MPLIYKVQTDLKSDLGVWQVNESASFFVEKLEDLNFPTEKLPARQIEKLGTRHLLNVLSDKKVHDKIKYDDFGKPYLVDNIGHISFSHKKDFIAVIFSKDNKFTGIDVEIVGKQPVKLASKFISTNDLIPEDVFSIEQKCALIWSAKETLYKTYGKKELDFKKNLEVLYDRENHLIGRMKKGSQAFEIPLKYKFMEEIVLVHTI